MPDQKIDNLLNLAMDATPQERRKSGNLNVGYDPTTRLWDVIIKYSGPESGLAGNGIQVVPLLGGYAVVTLPESEIDKYSHRAQVEFVEKPKRLYFELFQAKGASCIRTVQTGRNGLTGKGILTGVVDSGVDYFHPDFRNADGSSRILRLWDQSIQGKPPQGYVTGTEYTKEEIDEALALGENQGRRLVPSVDYSGHGTSVLGIAAGNGRASGGANRGIAYESELLVVKMKNADKNSFPRTTELMEGVDYLIRQSIRLGKPIVVNISFGNNYGSHKGDSLLETYLDSVSAMGRNVVCTGMGNNGNDALHTGGKLSPGETQEIELGVGAFEPTLNVQLWKNYEDEMEIYLENPAGERVGPLSEILGAQRWQVGNTELLIYYGKPAPYHVTQEIYVDFLAQDGKRPYVDSGVWKIILAARNIKSGEYFLWLPGGKTLNPGTAFYLPRPQGTLTIPATARRLISVGAYDSRLLAYAGFSGRGSSELPYEKPDLTAPGVGITAPRAGGGYGSYTGTSFAVPFVSGSAALLMEWGIIKGNDPYLYGEKVKAYLRRGTKPLPEYEQYPNYEVGWGRLCLSESIPK
ncbi:MAG: S8 family peptidase [Blautia sp.]|uniref:S8 family serine peptidase n=3 Tax=Blautia TaxID=572511 RepID=A0ABT2TWF7_9FIRM|nr:S8 family peptidase [Blautia ammoniilytica]MCU6766578.1 S8 family serine peptidase [Blautia ammoniilytica]SCI68970.1 Minor extracellular protease vpr precursor [uncultured Blautia sp.]